MKDVAESYGSPLPQVLQGSGNRDELCRIGRGLRVLRQDVEFLENPALHLLGSLVRESHGKDVAVRAPVFLAEEKPDVCLCEIEGLA